MDGFDLSSGLVLLVSTGAADDLQKVTSIARAIVMRYGMHEGLGNVVYEEDRQSFL
jgi:cell division protease FtsH